MQQHFKLHEANIVKLEEEKSTSTVGDFSFSKQNKETENQ